MKLLPVEYLGSTTMERRFSNPMLPWIIAEIRRRNTVDKICVGVEEGMVQAYDTNFEQQFDHKLALMVRLSHVCNSDANSFIYILRDSNKPLLHCHLFRATRNEDVQELFKQMKEQGALAGHSGGNTSPKYSGPTRSVSSAANLTSLCADISPSSSHFFEVLYIGKIKVSQKKIPDTFIDDALCKFQAHEQGKLKAKTISQLKQGTQQNDSRRGSQDSTISDIEPTEINAIQPIHNPVLLSPLTPLEPVKAFVSRSNSQQDITDKDASSKRAAFSNVTGRTRTISEGSDTGIKIETTATSLDLDDTCTELSNQTKPMLIPKSVPDSFSASYKEISKSFDNASHLSEHNIAAARLGTSIGSGIAGRKCGSIEALPTLAEDDKKFSLTQHLKGSLMRDRSSSIGHGPTARPLLRKQDSTEHNRTMVFQVGRTDLRLISPDRKQILLHKQLRDVVSCIQGVKSTEHFGFICREPSNEFFMGYIFKCQSNSVSIEVVQAITQAFHATAEALKHPTRPALMSCEHCPMVWYHRLCAEIESQGDRKTQAIIFRKISCLDEEEQAVILTKFKGAETDSTREQNEFLMMLLRAHCEAKQNRHVHDTAENRSEFLNQYLGGSTIFMKAKRSLTNSFDHLLKRKGSNNDFGHSRELSLPVSRENSPHPQTLEVPECNFSPVACRSRTSTISSLNGDDKSPSTRTSPEHIDSKDEKNGTYLKSPMMDIFFKVGSSPKSDNTDSKTQRASWRQEMFNRVVTPNKTDMVPETEPRRKRTREELRKLWKKSINQALLLVRMEKENARLKARQEESAVKRIKLEYDEINPCHRELMDIWELLVSKESRISTKCDTQMLLQAIRQGVPRSKRGDVWHFLAEQFCIKQPPIDTANFPNFNTPYEQLLTQLTSHQHAILIDLGRTFPNHTYFSSSLGPGQLALFNLLKAYSLLDPEVGYCQGLSFVAGVLLLHMSEDEAFFLLRHLMFRRGLRSQYLPDMVALQVHLYQLSRLLHDQIPELYEHFNTHEVAPTLYAAPWVLTIFASQFPLGFVTRVFDLLFLENQDVIFKVAIALLNYHKENLLACDCFEDIMDYLRNTVPSIDRITYDKVMNQVFHTDISRQMNEYQVEYHVLQEEMASVRPQLDSLAKMEQQNKTLVEQNQNLSEQLQMVMSNAQRLETTRAIHQGTVNRLEAQVRSLEVTVETLGSFINQIIESKIDIEIPGDVRRIVAQIALSEKRMNARMATNSTNNPPPKKFEPQKNMVKSLSMSRLGLNFNRNKEELVPRSHSVNIGLGNSLVQNLKQTENEKHNSILNTVNENLSKIEDKGHRGFPLRVIEDDTPYEPMKTQSLKTIPPLKSTLSQPSMGNKTGFFANSHNHIQQQRMQYLALKQGTSPEKNNDSNLVRNMTEGSNKILTDAGKLEPIKQVSLNTNFIKLDDPLDISNNLIEKSVSLPLETINSFKSDNLSKSDSNNESKDSSVDSGISTPLSPSNERTINEIPLYDSDINFTFNGTTQLRSIKPVAKVGKTQH